MRIIILFVIILFSASLFSFSASANGESLNYGNGGDADPNLIADTILAAGADGITVKEYGNLTLNGFFLTFTDSFNYIMVKDIFHCGDGGGLSAIGRGAAGGAAPAAQPPQGRGGAGGNGGGSIIVLAKQIRGNCTFSAGGASGSDGENGGTPIGAANGNGGGLPVAGRSFARNTGQGVAPAGGLSIGTGGAGGTAPSPFNAQYWKPIATFLNVAQNQWSHFGGGGQSGANGAVNIASGSGGGGGGSGGTLVAGPGPGANGGTATPGASTGGGGGGGGGSGGIIIIRTEDDFSVNYFMFAPGGDGGAAGSANVATGGAGGRGGGGGGGFVAYVGPRQYTSITVQVDGGARGEPAATGVPGGAGSDGNVGIQKNIFDTTWNINATTINTTWLNATQTNATGNFTGNFTFLSVFGMIETAIDPWIPYLIWGTVMIVMLWAEAWVPAVMALLNIAAALPEPPVYGRAASIMLFSIGLFLHVGISIIWNVFKARGWFRAEAKS